MCVCVCVWVANTSHMAGDGRSTANVNKPQKWIVSGCSALLLIALNHNVALRQTTVSSCDSECFVFVSFIVFCFVLHYFVFWLFIYLIACNSISQLRSCAEHAKLWAKWNLRERERRAVEWEQVPFCFDYCLMLSSSLNRVPTALAVKWSVLGNAFSVLHIYSVYIIFNYS